jgi:DNA primase
VIIHSPGIVLELLDHNPALRVYQYTKPGTRQLYYAVFELDPEADPQLAQLLTTATLLCDNGRMTPAGRAWIVEHGRKG